MQTLGISDSTVRTEGLLKSLFWPSIQSGADVDYLGTQGYWVCTIVAVLSLLVSAMSGSPIYGLVVFLVFYGGGVGVRERSRYAAGMVFTIYTLDALFILLGGIFAFGFSLARVVIIGLLLSNLRATWIAASWRPESEEAALPPRMGDTLMDKLADRFPQWLWPKIRAPYYILSGIVFLLSCLGIIGLMLRRAS